MAFSTLLAIAFFCAGSALALVLADNQWAKDHAWAIPVLWTLAGACALASIASTRWFRSLFISQEEIRQKDTHQETHGDQSPISHTAGRDIHQTPTAGDHSQVLIESNRNIVAGRDVHVHQTGAAPPRPPRIALISHGSIPDSHLPSVRVGQTGVYLANDGAVAYEVLIEPFEIEPAVWARSKAIQRIDEKHSDYALVWLHGYPPFPFNTGKWDLLGAMKRAADAKHDNAIYRPDYSVKVSVIYRDADNWYRTTAPLTYIRSQQRLEFGPPSYESCGTTRPPEIIVPATTSQHARTPQLQCVGIGGLDLGELFAHTAAVRNIQYQTATNAEKARTRLEFYNEMLCTEGLPIVVEPGGWLPPQNTVPMEYASTTDLQSEQLTNAIYLITRNGERGAYFS